MGKGERIGQNTQSIQEIRLILRAERAQHGYRKGRCLRLPRAERLRQDHHDEHYHEYNPEGRGRDNPRQRQTGKGRVPSGKPDDIRLHDLPGIPRVHRRMHELSGRCKAPRKRSA